MTATSATAGTSFSIGTRAAVAGISNWQQRTVAAATGKTLIITTAQPVDVCRYIYTLTANGMQQQSMLPVTVKSNSYIEQCGQRGGRCSNVSTTYTATSATAGTTFSWTELCCWNHAIWQQAGSGCRASKPEKP